MAQMIPDRLPSHSSQGEKKLFEVLQKLPDDYIVYYEPVISNRYPDFVVIAPDLGILVIEVKGWYPRDVQGGNLNEVQVVDRGVTRTERHPIRQARDYQLSLQDECRKSPPARSQLLHAQGEYQGRFVFPFGHFAVLSNITADQLRGHAAGDLTALFPPDKVVTRDLLLSWADKAPEEIRSEIRRFFNPFWDIQPLTARQVDVLRSVVHPEIKIQQAQDDDQLAVLDMRQERHARSIGSGHRVLYGVAGSGKTVLLVSRARFLAQEHSSAQVLVLCFNVSLAAYLRATLREHGNVHGYHFDGWAKANGTARRGFNGKVEDDRSLGDRLKSRLQAGEGDARRFDAVLIDEAQDFDGSWFECVLEAMKEPNDGDLLIVGDRQQGILGPRTVVWSKVGVNARGRTMSASLDLDKNYRNSREILELAACFAQDTAADADEDQFGIVPVDPAKALRSTGVLPTLIRANDREGEWRAVVAQVRQLLRLNGQQQPDPRYRREVSPSQIGVLYPYLARYNRPVMEAFLKQLREVAPAVWLSDSDRSRGDGRARVSEAGIKVQTVHSAKGLQYAAVFLLWADLLPRSGENADPAEDAKLMYVGLTRPEDYLFMTYSKSSDFIRRIEESGKVTTV